jgi:hypothetical protein
MGTFNEISYVKRGVKMAYIKMTINVPVEIRAGLEKDHETTGAPFCVIIARALTARWKAKKIS